ncbi:MAG: FAD-binding protein [Candidatus Kapabacteria bacterium]|nr:FAD-binding protein [Candidatus Kapabacteria bacterium]
MSRQASSNRTANLRWQNLHENVKLTVGEYHELWNPMPPRSTRIPEDVRATTSYVCSIIADAAARGKTIRSVGGAWSLSEVATSKDIMLGTRNLNLWFPLAMGFLDAPTNHDVKRIHYMQCGSSVGEVYSRLEKRNLTLPTSGASNGQTIAGAVSTGTHGSAFTYGAIQECVVGIHLITGSNPATDSILLERASDPVASQSLARRLGARIVRDDDQFNAALVSFGSMGFVMGYIINAEPIYHLESWRRVVPYDGLVKALMTTLDVDLVPMIVPSLPVHADKIWHVEVVLNPHDPANAYLTIMERWDTNRRLSAPEPVDTSAPGDDLLSVIGGLTAALPSSAGTATSTLLNLTFGDRGPVVATPYGTFTAPTVRGSALSAEIGVPYDRSVDAVELLMSCPEIKKYAGIIACRFVKASSALLAFTQFPVTCTIELPGVKNANTQHFYDAAYARLFASDIPVTAHWGQIYPIGDKILSAYGPNLHRWLAAREALLSAEMRSVFGHQSTPRGVTPGD